MKLKPYIGITGIACPRECKSLIDHCAKLSAPMGYLIHAGVLLSDQTFRGEASHIARYPDRETAYELMMQIAGTWSPIIHYNSREKSPLSKQVEAIFRYREIYANRSCRALQLNVPDPDVEELQRIRESFPELTIVLQVPLWRSDLQEGDGLNRFVARYANLVSHLLFDPSGGRGTGLSEERLRLCAEALELQAHPPGIALAGGFSSKNIQSYCQTIRTELGAERPFSIDAEGKLRGGRWQGEKVGDRMNPEKVRAYLEQAIQGLDTANQSFPGACPHPA